LRTFQALFAATANPLDKRSKTKNMKNKVGLQREKGSLTAYHKQQWATSHKQQWVTFVKQNRKPHKNNHWQSPPFENTFLYLKK
jgi:hypothetical protein